MPSPIVTVSQLDAYIKGIFDAEEILHGIRVDGEVSGFSVKSDNAYFTLKDSASQILCCCFRISKTFLPKDGDKVILTGRPDFYTKTGKLSFIADFIELNGIGKLFQEFIALKNKLESEGLFSSDNKIPLPIRIKNLCVITSHQGAVIQDILSTIYKTTDKMHLSAVDVKVQGIGATESIVKALSLADKEGFDAVILARGGGSFEDLMPFNTEEVARAVAAMTTPIISAIGHETDVSLADFAADVRALTPTAAAELVCDGWRILSREFQANKATLKRSAEALFRTAEEKVKHLRESMSLKVERIFEKKTNAFCLLHAKITALDPNLALKNGFIVAEKNGKRVKELKELHADDLLILYFPDGKAQARVTKTEEI